MAETTALEALTAELLGDVGKLHDRVKDLEAALPDAGATIRQAGKDAADQIMAAVKQGEVDLANAVKAERQAAAEISGATAKILQEIVTAAKAAGEAEGTKVQVKFVTIAEEILQQVKKEAKAAAPAGWNHTFGMGVFAGFLGSVLGLGAAWISHRDTPPVAALTVEQTKQLEAGRDFLQVLPQLDNATKDKLVKMIQKNRQ